MALIGPIKPRRYINYTSAAPNPDSQTYSAQHEIVTCPKTGRMWIQQSAVSPWSWQQFLPYVAANGTNPTTGVQVVNSSGNMALQRPAGMTNGNLNAFGTMVVDTSNVNLPLQAQGSVFVDSAKNLRSETFGKLFISGDANIATANTMQIISGFTFAPAEDGIYRVRLQALFTHNNAFTASAGIRVYESASVNWFVASTSGSAQGNNGWVSLSCEAMTTIQATNNQSFRAFVQTTDAGVTLKRKAQANFPFNGIPADLDQATSMYIERIG